jgi:hypothetical protein
MKTIFDTDTLAPVLARIELLQPASPRQWGKMDAAQMLAHCCATVEMANGAKVPPRTFLGKILGPVFKSSLFNEKPFPHNSPTDKTFIIADAKDFSREQARLLELVKSFGEGGEAKCTTHTHAFFGDLTPREWGLLVYKHLDHHLRQFSV